MDAGAYRNGKPLHFLSRKTRYATFAGDMKNRKDRQQRDQQPFRLAFGKSPPLTQGRLK